MEDNFTFEGTCKTSWAHSLILPCSKHLETAMGTPLEQMTAFHVKYRNTVHELSGLMVHRHVVMIIIFQQFDALYTR